MRTRPACFSARFLCSLTLILFFGTSCELRPPGAGNPGAPGSAPGADATETIMQDTSPPVPDESKTGIVPVRYRFGSASNAYPLLHDVRDTDSIPGLEVTPMSGSGTGLRIDIPLKPDECIWGFGERFDAFNLRGRSLETWTTDGWNNLNTSYFAVPFFISSEGYGYFINHSGRLQFDIGKSDPGRIIIEVPDTGVEIVRFAGTPAEVSRGYTRLVGRPRNAPEWMFRPWMSRNSYLGAYEVDYVVNRMEKLGMPVGVVVLEAWEEQLHNFKFARNRYPEPEQWIASLRERGVHVVCWLTSSMWQGTDAYRQARDRGYLVLNPDGSEHVVRWLENGRKVDFRKPGAFEWWRDLHKPLVEMGVSGFKTDGGEHMPDPFFHNQHTYFYQKAALDAFENTEEPGITFARSANPLNAGLGAFWAGDQEAEWSRLAGVVRGGLSAALSGFPLWTHDIGAYTGHPAKDLYIRWLQLGAFSPLMQFHGIEAREPWIFDRETLVISRFYFQVRERLLNELAARGREAVEDGTPIMRPLIWHFPDDLAARETDDEFMLGPDLLVAPVTAGLNERLVYLPAERWVDMWTGEQIQGPARFVRRVPLEQIPLYVREQARDRYAGLLTDAPVIPTNGLSISLAGDRDVHGIVPSLRYWRHEQEEEYVRYEIRNDTDEDIRLQMVLPAPEGFSVDPPEPFAIEVAAHTVQRLQFRVVKTDPDPFPLTYPFRLSARTAAGEIETPPVGLVVSPQWQVNGLFEFGVGSEQSLDGQPVHPDGVYTGKYARVFSWRPLPDAARDAHGRYDISEITGPDGSSTTYLHTRFNVLRPGTYTILSGFGDEMKMWLDGREIQRISAHRNPSRDEDAVRVRLSAGYHELLIRNSRDLAKPQFYFRMID